MKKLLFSIISLAILFGGCTTDQINLDYKEKIDESETISFNDKRFKEYLKSRVVLFYNYKGDEPCGVVAEDFAPPGSTCFLNNGNYALPTSGTSLSLSACTTLQVSYTVSWCLSGGKLHNIVISNFEIDYDYLINTCGVSLPTGQAALEAYLDDLEREFSEIAEIYEIIRIFNISGIDASCIYLNDPVIVKRVSTTCFKYCYGINGSGNVSTVEKQTCEGDVCCYTSKEVCEDDEENLVITNVQNWRTTGECSTAASCSGFGYSTNNCDHNCEQLYSE